MTATYEQVGTTQFGDPEIVMTIGEPHPKAGFQLLFKSTASMDHMQKKARGSKTAWLVYDYPQRPNARGTDGWHGSLDAKTVDDLVESFVEYATQLHEREQVRDQIWTGELREHLERFDRALYETSALDYVQEWDRVLAEVARIQLVMSEAKAKAANA